ncbi:hypothetical protein [Actinomyces naeslundii]|uniref:hypothetical protein n=1 Tax=Actinomyces naeslundii TaxID=1655 RepID=UPI000AC1AE56|nr:hypothetical protein [Actinomyces naeslundii]
MNLFTTTLLRGAWRLAKVIAATAISTAGAHMLIIPMFIEPAINFASRTPSKILYGSIASCFGAFMIFLASNALFFEGVEIDGHPKWSGWTVLSMLFSSIAISATRRATELVPSVALSINLVLLSGFVLFLVIDDIKRQRSQERSMDDLQVEGPQQA